ncbi:unnamed protein product [Musa hybrid cultivar]
MAPKETLSIEVAEDAEEELEPLFNYGRVQPVDFLSFEDDAFDSSPIVSNGKRKRASDPTELKARSGREAMVVLDDDEEDLKAQEDADWLPLPPPRVPSSGLGLQEDSTLLELRLHKQELASLAQSAQEVLQQVEEAAKMEHNNSGKSVEQQPKQQVQRQKIVISIQDKEGQKQFRIYTDDKFERLFKLYAEKVQVKLDNLVFSFDGDKISTNTTPDSLGLEDDDIIEVHVKSQ